MAFSENVEKRFEAYGWQVLRVEERNDLAAISKAIAEAKADTTRPTLIEVKTIIGFGSPNKGGKGGHVGTSRISAWRRRSEIDEGSLRLAGRARFPMFRTKFARTMQKLKRRPAAEQAWSNLLHDYIKAYPELGSQFERGN